MSAMAVPSLRREMFSVSRASEYFDARELQAQTGQPRHRFAAVALKELVDNALDACEAAGVSPVIDISVRRQADRLVISVQDNGDGIEPETVARILDFASRTSDKAAYRSPTRGPQGNALKTIVGIPHALGERTPVVIQARGAHHCIRAWLDPAGTPRVEFSTKMLPTRGGTRVALALPASDQQLDGERWARAFSILNPHASVKISPGDTGSKHTLNRRERRRAILTDPRLAWATTGASGCRAIPRLPGGTRPPSCGGSSSSTSRRPGNGARAICWSATSSDHSAASRRRRRPRWSATRSPASLA
jgi:DNA topoisomerase VI subunit B